MINKSDLTRIENDEINAIHLEEVEILNALIKLIESAADTEAITHTFQRFIDHMQAHFAYEEGLMKASGYGMYSIHQAEHYKVLNEARYNFMDWSSSKDIERLQEYCSEDLVAWYDQHVDAMDKPMAAFLNEGDFLLHEDKH